jgi:hypothetical protein
VNPARTTYLLLVFLLFTIVAHADPIFIGESSRAAVPQIGSWSSVGENSNASLDVYSWTSAGKFRQSDLKLTLADTKSGGVPYRGSLEAFTQPRLMLSLLHIKNDAKHKKDKDKGGDDDYHAVPEPPMAATLAMGLTLLLFKLRRSNRPDRR